MAPASARASFHDSLLGAADGVHLDQARLNDQQRIGVVLQGAALLSHLEHGGWVLTGGWDDLRLNRDGLLRATSVQSGRSGQLVQIALCRLLRQLFHTEEKIAGRGTARNTARHLISRWQQVLAPLTADQAVNDIFQAAPFLWNATFAKVRATLVANHSDGVDSHLWLAGPGAARRRFLNRGRDQKQIEALLEGEGARDLWDGWNSDSDPRELTDQRRWRQAAVAWRRDPPKGRQDRLAHARCLFALGLYTQTLETLKGLSHPEARLIRAWSQNFLGELPAAHATMRRLAKTDLSPEQLVELTELAIRLLAALGKTEEIEAWVARSLAATQGNLRLRAGIAAAGAAWDRKDLPAMGRYLEESRQALDIEDLASRWHHMRGLYAMLAKDEPGAVEHIATALRLGRKRMSRTEAGRLWNDLAVSRVHADDLPGAERASRHTSRLLRDCDGPSRTTLALYNLAEIRLRRGRGLGVESILELSTAENRHAGNLRGLASDLELWVRLELAQGRSHAALTRCAEARQQIDRDGFKDRRSIFDTFAARAHGWLGRRQNAAECLERADDESIDELEPEERPALWALAGRSDRACEEAAGTRWAPLWKAIAAGTHPAPEVWHELDSLEPFRASRLIFDCELLQPGITPPHRVRAAIAALRHCNADTMADSLESLSLSSWRALGRYLAKSPRRGASATSPRRGASATSPRRGASATSPRRGANSTSDIANTDFEELFINAGYANIRLSWIRDDLEQTLVSGSGGKEQLAHGVDAGGRLILQAPFVDDVLRTLVTLIGRDLEAATETNPKLRPTPHRDGIVGESQALLKALRRLDRLAEDDLPIVIIGESGTGKELTAKRAHRMSRRNGGPFLPINCAAVQESLIQSDLFGHVKGSFTGADRDRPGIFELARSGTVFLDEIGDLPLVAQGKLLRVLQEGEIRRVGESFARKVDVRVITATHRDLEHMVSLDEFRRDLYFRLKVATVTLPPLRERGKDILLLVEHFLTQRRSTRRLSGKARARLLSHHWPGNIRELQNVLGVADTLAQGQEIHPTHLDLPQPATEAKGDYHQMVEQYRRDLISKAMAETGGNRAAAARRLGLSRQALSYLVRQLGLS